MNHSIKHLNLVFNELNHINNKYMYTRILC